MNSRHTVNAISLSRILFGFCFVVVFQPNYVLFWFSVLLVMLFFLSDILDGYLARKFNIASVHGRQWDSLGDKAFYMAVVVAFLAQSFVEPVLAWGLIVREIALYILRVIYIEKLGQLEKIRPYTNWHGYFMYGFLLLGLINLYGQISMTNYDLYLLTQLMAAGALFFGVSSIFKFLSLTPP